MAQPFKEKVRQAAFELIHFTANDLASALNIHTEEDMRRLRISIGDLKFKKELVSLRRGFYCYQEKQKSLSQIAKMWRAIRIKEYFTRQDIKRLSGASEGYVVNYFKCLVSNGFIGHVSGRGFKERSYRLNNPGTAPLKHPVHRIGDND